MRFLHAPSTGPLAILRFAAAMKPRPGTSVERLRPAAILGRLSEKSQSAYGEYQ
jgi:hypothetical protein